MGRTGGWGASGGQRAGDAHRTGGKKKDTYSNHHKKCKLLRVVHMLLTRVQEVARPATAPASTSRQVLFGGLGVDEMTSPLGTADWEDYFWCAG